MKNVFAVQDEYGVAKLFSTQKNAKLYANVMPPADYALVNEWNIEEDVCDEIKQGLKVFRIGMAMDGTLIYLKQRRPTDIKPLKYSKELMYSSRNNKYPKGWKLIGNLRSMYAGSGIYGVIWAKNKEGAIEIIDEYRKQNLKNDY